MISLKERKLNIIQKLIEIDDTEVFNELEKVLNISVENPFLKKFSKKNLIERAQKSEEDINSGKVFLQDEVESFSKDW